MSSGESDTDEDIPPADECQKRCLRFAEVTDTDTACAQFYLQDRKWDLQASVSAFFEDRANKGALRVNDNNESEVVLVLDGSSPGLAAAATAVVTEAALSSQRPSSSTNKSPEKSSLSSQIMSFKELKFITWNIDGLDEKNLKLRTKAVRNIILKEQADVVFLQEVVPDSAAYFIQHLPNYECLFGAEDGYFVGTFIKKPVIKVESHGIIEFPHTVMNRNILRVNIQIGLISLCLMNVHLESTADHSEERKKQLQMSFREISLVPQSRSVIFAGDMNLRDKELAAIGGLPAGIQDVWVMLGSRKSCSYTWDMVRNDNLLYNSKNKPRLRFDRVFFRASSPSKLRPKHFGLIGLERLLPHRCFPSDHWGILCHFGVE